MSRAVPLIRHGGFSILTTTSGFFNADVDLQTAGLGAVSLGFVAGAGQGATVKVLASLDGGATYPYTAVTSFAVAAGAAAIKSVGLVTGKLRAQAQAATTSAVATVTGQWLGVSAAPGTAI